MSFKTLRRFSFASFARLSTCLLVGAALCAAPGLGAQARVEAPDLLTPHFAARLPAAAGVLRSQAVHVDVPLLRAVRPGHVLRLRLFRDVAFELELTSIEVEERIPDTFHWHGKLRGYEGSDAILTVHRDAFAAWIYPNDPEFQSLAIQGAPGMYVVRELDNAAHRPEAQASPAGVGTPMGSACNDYPDRIDMLFVYGDGTLADAGGSSKAIAGITNAVAQINNALRRSSLLLRVSANAIRYVKYTATGNNTQDLGRLRGNTDGYIDQIHTWRRNARADLVSYVRRGSRGGTAFCKSDWTRGFNVVDWGSLGALALAKVFGLNCGLSPNPRSLGTCKPTSFGRGYWFKYFESGSQRRYAYTVMSNPATVGDCGGSFSCTNLLVPNFSAPGVNLFFNSKAYATGTATQNNRRALFQHRQDIANYSILLLGGNKAPAITRQPSNATRRVGSNSTPNVMSVAIDAFGNTVSYQWRKNGSALSGQTNAALSLPTITLGDAGRYDCVVTSCAGSTTSSAATLTVVTTRELRRGPTYPGPNWGQVVANVGDIDRDGYPDIGIGHPNATYGSANAGHVEILSGRTHARITFWRDGISGAMQQGYAIAGADVNADSYSDVFSGAPGWSSNRGKVVWYSRREGRLRSIALGTNAGQRMGTALDLAQLDKDTQKDLVVSGKDTVYAYSSRNWSSASWPQLWKITPFPGTDITRIVTVGDVNFDGYDDIALGLPDYASKRGLVQVRSGRDGALIWQRFGDASGNLYGAALAPAGDVTKNGIADLLIGEPGFAGGAGRVISMHGDRGSAFRVLNGASGANFGRSLAFVGDYNEDGVPDFAIGQRGRVEIRRGQDYGVLWTRTGNPNFGVSLAGLDSNKDSVPDVAIGELGVAVWLRDAAPKANPPQWQSYGATCDGSAKRAPRLRGGLKDPRVGGSYEIVQYGLPANSVTLQGLAFGRRNIPLDAFGMNGCSIWIESALLRVGVPTGRGEASTSWSIPNEAKFAGRKVHWQSIVLDQNANSLGVTASHGLEMTIGAR